MKRRAGIRILVVGGGGREHALVWKISRSPLVKKVFCAPGNGGIAQIAECIDINASDIEGLAEFTSKNKIDLTVVGPEAPLIDGIVDVFESRGLPIFGPSKDPARIEGSKAFAKEIMRVAGIPTASFWICNSLQDARSSVRDYFATHDAGIKIVIKADGIAAGKGVTVASDEAEAQAALDRIMGQRVFGASGDSEVFEYFATGKSIA